MACEMVEGWRLISHSAIGDYFTEMTFKDRPKRQEESNYGKKLIRRLGE